MWERLVIALGTLSVLAQKHTRAQAGLLYEFQQIGFL